MRLLVVLAACVALAVAFPETFSYANVGAYANGSAVCAPPVRNQGVCGGCYTFAASATLGTTLCNQDSSATLMAMLSPQMVLNAVYNAKGGGEYNPCSGGSTYLAIDYVSGYETLAPCNEECSSGCLPYFEAECTTESSNLLSCDTEEGCQCSSFSSTVCGTDDDLNDDESAGFDPPSFSPSVMFYNPNVEATLASLALTADNAAALQAQLMETGPVAISTYGEAMILQYQTTQYCMTAEDILQDVPSFDTSTLPPGCDDSYQLLTTWLPNAVSVPLSEDGQPLWARCCPDVTQPLDVSTIDQVAATHAVTIVGWTTINGQQCWIIQNSWGSDWGDDGLFYVAFDDTAPAVGNFLATVLTFVTVGSSRRDDNQQEWSQTMEKINAIPGRPVQVNDRAQINKIVNGYLSKISAKRGLEHRLASVETVTRGVVNGIMFRIQLYATDESDNHAQAKHHHASLLWKQGQLSLASVRIEPGKPGDDLRSHVALGICVAIVAIAALAVVAYHVHRRRTRAEVAPRHELENLIAEN